MCSCNDKMNDGEDCSIVIRDSDLARFSITAILTVPCGVKKKQLNPSSVIHVHRVDA